MEEKTNTAKQTTAVAKTQESVADMVLQRVTTMENGGELTLPEGYHVGNALKSAWLYLQSVRDKAGRPVTESCTKNSIANCLLEMVIRGEHPMRHCYFIPTGNQLSFFEKYTGKLMRAKRDTEIADVSAQVVYKGDEFTYTVDENGRYQLVSHKTSIQNMTPANVVAAYAVVVNRDGTRHLEVMTIDMIRAAWGQGAAKGNSMAHRGFTDQMAKKSVIARACKVALESTSDGYSAPSDEREDYMAEPHKEIEREQANVSIAAAAPTETDPYELAADDAESEVDVKEEGKEDDSARKCPV